MRRALFVLICSTVVLISACLPAFTQVLPKSRTVEVRQTYKIDGIGTAKYDAVMTFTPRRDFTRLLKASGSAGQLFRDLGYESAHQEFNRGSFLCTANESVGTLRAQGSLLGFAVARRGQWQIPLAIGETLVSKDTQKVITSRTRTESTIVTTITTTYLLPEAQQVRVNDENTLITYVVPAKTYGKDPPRIDVTVRYKECLMASLYKIYGDARVEDGAYWVAKVIVRNVGTTPITDLRLSYRVGDYTAIANSERYDTVLPGGGVVNLYYPIFTNTERLTRLKTQTPAQLSVQYTYRDSKGTLYIDDLTRRLEVLGINQFQWSNLSDADQTDNWADHFNNAPLMAAFVTRMDDPVKQFAGYVSEAAGGVAASTDDASARKWLKAAYDLEVANGIVYQTPSSFMTTDQGAVQELKYPRDVFRDKAGTCVDLAILYAALAESTGLHAYLMVIPGHCFAMIELPSGDYLPVENTGLGGGNTHMTFEEAVETATKEVKAAIDDERFYLVDVKEQLATGRVPNPELVALGPTYLRDCGVKRTAEIAVKPHEPAQTDAADSTEKLEISEIGLTVMTDAELQNMVLQMLGSKMSVRKPFGTMAVVVAPNSMAAKAGIVPGSVLVAVDGAPLYSGNDLQRLVRQHAGERLKVQVIEIGEGELNENTVMLDCPGNGKSSGPVVTSADETALGLTVIADAKVQQHLYDAFGSDIGAKKPFGLLVKAVRSGSVAARAGIGEASILLAMDNTLLFSPDDLRKLTHEYAGRTIPVLVLVFNGDEPSVKEIQVAIPAVEPTGGATALLGMTVKVDAELQELTRKWMQNWGQKNIDKDMTIEIPVGVVVTAVEAHSPAAKAGITAGQVVVGVKDEGFLSSEAQLKKLIAANAGKTLTLMVLESSDDDLALKIIAVTVPR